MNLPANLRFIGEGAKTMPENMPEGRAAGMEHAIVKAYRKTLWQPFIAAVQRYGLIPADERVHVRLRMDGALFTAAKLLQEMHRHTLFPFELTFSADGAEAAALAADLGIPLSGPAGGETGVLPECMTDAVETLMTSLLKEGSLRALPPVSAVSGARMIRPLYCVERRDLRRFALAWGLPWTEPDAQGGRGEIRALLDSLRAEDRDVETRLFRAAHATHPATFPSAAGGSASAPDSPGAIAATEETR